MAIANEKTFAQGCEEFINNCCARNLRDGTIKHYKESIRQIGKYLDEDMYIKDISKETFYMFVKALRDNPVLNSVSVYTYSRDLKTILNFFMRSEYLPKFKVEITKADRKPIETYTDTELIKLLKKPNLKHCSFTEYKSWVIVNFLLSTGIRQRSLINIQIKDVDFDNDVVNINVTKNGKPLIIPLNSDIIRILKEYLKYRDGEPSDYLFCNVYGKQLVKSTIYHEMYEYNKARGVEKTGMHRYRHTFAKKWVLMGGNVVTLQKILSHSSLQITQNYLNVLVSDIKEDVEEFNILREFKRESIRLRS
jgi:integrase/recombinase XerD